MKIPPPVSAFRPRLIGVCCRLASGAQSPPKVQANANASHPHCLQHFVHETFTLLPYYTTTDAFI